MTFALDRLYLSLGSLLGFSDGDQWWYLVINRLTPYFICYTYELFVVMAAKT